MKNIKFLSFLMIATSLLFIQCTTDPIPGTSGVDGQDGSDGSDGLDGASGTTECAACHNISTSEGVHASYLFSQHSIETDATWADPVVPISTYANRGSCAVCHTNEGYIDYAMTGTATDAPYPGTDQKITCTTCHDTHKTFDFENDGFDFALRMLRPVELIVDPSYTINYEGTSNNCAFCHQPRTAPPVDIDDSGTFKVTNTHWGPHHGPQSTFLEGIQGAEIAGAIEYPAAASATHRTGTSCTECHMGETSGGIDGNHTWNPNFSAACTTCHPTVPEDGVAGLKDDMASLLVILEEVGILREEYGSVHPVVGEYNITEAEAAWNYLLVMEDKSNGTHNPNYAKALIGNSLEVLGAE